MDVIDLVGCSQIVIGIVNLQPENLKRVSYFEIHIFQILFVEMIARKNN